MKSSCVFGRQRPKHLHQASAERILVQREHPSTQAQNSREPAAPLTPEARPAPPRRASNALLVFVGETTVFQSLKPVRFACLKIKTVASAGTPGTLKGSE